jgi:hypothetical protein
VIAIFAAAFGLLVHNLGNGSTPSCSWPMRVQGKANPQQVGLVRCYLRDLASNDRQGLAGLMAATGQGAHVTAHDLVHAKDARSGVASAWFAQNPVDPTNASVQITFADGATWDGGLYNMVSFAPQGPNEWRMAIGSDWE